MTTRAGTALSAPSRATVEGNLAAATSTGGMTGKLPGRVGDSPLIGAGTFADNATCAISATGDGEFFIRFGVAHEVAARIRHRGDSLAEAAGAVIAELGRIGGSGGLVAVGRDGASGAAVQLLRHVSRLRRGRRRHPYRDLRRAVPYRVMRTGARIAIYETMQNTRLAMLDHDLGPEIDMLRTTVRDFAEDRIAPDRRRDRPRPTASRSSCGPRWARSGCTASRSRRNTAAPAWGISRIASRWRRSAAPRPRSASPTARTRTSASTRSAATAARRRSANTCRS